MVARAELRHRPQELYKLVAAVELKCELTKRCHVLRRQSDALVDQGSAVYQRTERIAQPNRRAYGAWKIARVHPRGRERVTCHPHTDHHRREIAIRQNLGWLDF